MTEQETLSLIAASLALPVVERELDDLIKTVQALGDNSAADLHRQRLEPQVARFTGRRHELLAIIMGG